MSVAGAKSADEPIKVIATNVSIVLVNHTAIKIVNAMRRTVSLMHTTTATWHQSNKPAFEALFLRGVGMNDSMCISGPSGFDGTSIVTPAKFLSFDLSTPVLGELHGRGWSVVGILCFFTSAVTDCGRKDCTDEATGAFVASRGGSRIRYEHKPAHKHVA